MNNINIEFDKPDARPVFILEDVKSADFDNVKTEIIESDPIFWLKDVSDFSIHRVKPLKDQHLEKVEKTKL